MGQPCFAVGRFADVIACLLQRAPNQLANRFFIIDDQDLVHNIHHSSIRIECLGIGLRRSGDDRRRRFGTV